MKTFSVFLSNTHSLADIDKNELHGANVATSRLLRFWMSDARLDALEVFLPASQMSDHDHLARVAAEFLPFERKGQGALRFYALQHAERVWAATPAYQRAILCVDAVQYPQIRAMRDGWAAGPMPIFSDVHALSAQQLWSGFAPLINAPPAPFDRFVCRSRDCQRVFEKWMALNQGDIDSAPFGTIYSHTPLDLKRFRPADAARKRELRARFGWPADKNLAIVLGRLNPYSKADLLPLLNVWSRAATANDVLVLSGEAWPASYAQLLEAEAKRLDIEVITTGRVPFSDQADYFRAADFAIVVAETLVDIAPMTVCEAQACGVAVVASDWTGTRDRITHGENGFLVPTSWMPDLGLEGFSPFAPVLEQTLALAQSLSHDEIVWENCLRQLLRNPQLREQMGRAAAARAARDSSWQTVSQIWLDAWDEMHQQARNETPDLARARRESARKWARFLEYDAQFSHFATTRVACDDLAALSAQGRAALVAGDELLVYGDLQPLITPVIFEAIIQALMAPGPALSLEILILEIAEETGCLPRDARFHIALMRKRGWITLTPQI